MAGCSHRSFHTVNPQVVTDLRFAVRNKHYSLAEGGQTAYVTLNSARNEGSAGLNVPGFKGKGMILHCKMILAGLAVRLNEWTSRARPVSLVRNKDVWRAPRVTDSPLCGAMVALHYCGLGSRHLCQAIIRIIVVNGRRCD